RLPRARPQVPPRVRPCLNAKRTIVSSEAISHFAACIDMKIAYFDCFHGAAGDMLLAALLDAGLDLGALEAALGGLGLTGYALRPARLVSHGITGTRLDVEVAPGQPQRDWAQIRAFIEAAPLSERARRWALGAFGRLARAEAAIHGAPLDR